MRSEIARGLRVIGFERRLAVAFKVYAEEVVRAYARAGAYGTHVSGHNSKVDLTTAILSMARASEECLSTGFCVWQQDTIGWYIASSDNEYLKRELLPRIVRGETLGGTGMSNPMKAMCRRSAKSCGT